MKIVGLTGGIGSGKTTVAKVFETLGVPVFYADDEAKQLYVTNATMKAEIIKNFGPQTYVNGKLNREFLGKQVFEDKNKLELLNSIVHPQLELHYENWLEKHKNNPYVLKEAAILIEVGGYKHCNHVILVTASEKTRIQRVVNRDNTTEKQVKNRMDKQMPEEDKKEFCDFIIDNSGDEMVIPQVLAIHSQLLKQ